MVGIVPEVHQDLVEADRWLAILVGAWKLSQAIHMLEGRVVLLGLRRALCGIQHHGKGLLSMSDNLSCVLAFEKGRACDFELRTLTMQAAGWLLATDVSWHLRHVRTHRNALDHGSRLADKGELRPGEVWATPRWMVEWFTSRRKPVQLQLDLLVAPRGRKIPLALDVLVAPPQKPVTLNLFEALGLGELTK